MFWPGQNFNHNSGPVSYGVFGLAGEKKNVQVL